MARWRPRTTRPSPYITAEGYSELQIEIRSLWDRRAGVTQALSTAAAEGDRSENAEYIYRKKELRQLDRRIRYLQKRIPSLNVVREPPAEKNRIFFGAWVTLQNESGDHLCYRIVGPDEIDPEKGHISLDSPMAQSLLNKSREQEIVVENEHGSRQYTILKICYGQFSD